VARSEFKFRVCHSVPAEGIVTRTMPVTRIPSAHWHWQGSGCSGNASDASDVDVPGSNPTVGVFARVNDILDSRQPNAPHH
jgi:hypothetical protein